MVDLSSAITRCRPPRRAPRGCARENALGDLCVACTLYRLGRERGAARWPDRPKKRDNVTTGAPASHQARLERPPLTPLCLVRCRSQHPFPFVHPRPAAMMQVQFGQGPSQSGDYFTPVSSPEATMLSSTAPSSRHADEILVSMATAALEGHGHGHLSSAGFYQGHRVGGIVGSTVRAPPTP